MTGTEGAIVAACEGLGPVADRWVLNRRLREIHASTTGRLRPDERLLHAANLAYSDAAVDRVLAEARGGDGDVRIVLEAAALAPILALTGEAPAFTYLRGAGEGELTTRAEAAPTRVVNVKQTALPGFALPDAELQVVDQWALPIGHWAQLLWANLLALGPSLWQALGAGLGGAWRIAWAAVCTGSISPYRLARRVNGLGSGARVHPNATLEGCVLGPGVVVGAGAVVRGCVVGANARIEDFLAIL